MSAQLRHQIDHYLDAHTTLSLATDGPAGLWAAAILYVRLGPHLYFTSVASTRHGQNLEVTRRGVGTVSDECLEWRAMKGVQLAGPIEPVSAPAELLAVVTAYLRRFPFAAGMWAGEQDPAAIVADLGIHGFYRFTPTHLLFTDNEQYPQGRQEMTAGL